MAKTCPHCEAPLVGLGTWCYECGQRAVAKPPAKQREPAERKQTPADATLTLPWSSLVSVNKRKGGMVGRVTKEYRDKLEDMTMLLGAQYHGATHDSEVAVNMRFYPPDRRMDAHNTCKALFDSLEAAEIITNDKLITSWSGRVVELDPDEPRVEVTVRAVREGVV